MTGCHYLSRTYADKSHYKAVFRYRELFESKRAASFSLREIHVGSMAGEMRGQELKGPLNFFRRALEEWRKMVFF
jgi:hypothetical protein